MGHDDHIIYQLGCDCLSLNVLTRKLNLRKIGSTIINTQGMFSVSMGLKSLAVQSVKLCSHEITQRCKLLNFDFKI